MTAWWRNEVLLRAEVEKHGGQTAASQAHGGAPSPATISKWWRIFGLPRLEGGRHIHAADAELPISEIEALRHEVAHLRTTTRRLRTEDVVTERYAAVLAETVETTTPSYIAPKVRHTSKAEAHVFALEWSDLHASEVVSSEEMNGLNSYDWDTMLRRHDRILSAMVSFKDNRPYPVDGLHILALGDMVTGDIHDELRVTNEKVATEAAVQLAVDMTQWLSEVAKEFPWVRVSCVFGNHGRLTVKPSFKQAFNNWDWLFYATLAQSLSRHPSVHVEVSRAAQMPVDILGRRVLLWHGDGVRSTMPGVPWGGIIRRIGELDRTYDALGLPIDHYAVGHYHEANIVRNGRILMNGSVKGPDEYSLARFGYGAPPAQVLLTFHPKHGLTDTSFLHLT